MRRTEYLRSGDLPPRGPSVAGMSRSEPTPHRLPRRAVPATAAVLATVPVVVYLVGLPLHSDVPGTCDAWKDCSYSAREQWTWRAQSWAVLGIGLAAFAMVVNGVAPRLFRSAAALRGGSVLALWLLLPVTALAALVFVAILGADCSNAGWVCFGGPEDAAALTWPGLVTGGLATALLFGLRRIETPVGRGVGAAALSTLVGFVAAGAISIPTVAILSRIGEVVT